MRGQTLSPDLCLLFIFASVQNSWFMNILNRLGSLNTFDCPKKFLIRLEVHYSINRSVPQQKET